MINCEVEDYRDILLQLNYENEFEEEQNDERPFKKLKGENESMELDYKSNTDKAMELDYKSNTDKAMELDFKSNTNKTMELDYKSNDDKTMQLDYKSNDDKNMELDYKLNDGKTMGLDYKLNDDKTMELDYKLNDKLIKKNDKLFELDESTSSKLDNKSIDDKSIERKSKELTNKSKSEKRTNKTLYSKFKELKIDKNILKGLKLIKTIDNEEIIENHEKIYEFLNTRYEENYFIKLRSSGMNIAHLISCIEKVDANQNKPQLLIISCSLESANNTLEIVKLLTKFNVKIKSVSILGNDQLYSKIDEQIIVATVGSLMYYLFKVKLLSLFHIKLLVFEEFDILLSSDENIARIQSIVNSKHRCKMIFLSTCPISNALSIARNFSKNKFAKLDLLDTDNYFKNILQFQIETHTKDKKYDYLRKFLLSIKYNKLILFISGKYYAHQLNRELKKDNFNSSILTSELTIEQRLDTVRDFKNNDNIILVITYPLNVSSILECDLVINYDLNIVQKSFQREYFHNASHLLRLSKPGFLINFTSYEIERKLLNRFITKYDLNLYQLSIE